jgi:hypothetical protein
VEALALARNLSNGSSSSALTEKTAPPWQWPAWASKKNFGEVSASTTLNVGKFLDPSGTTIKPDVTPTIGGLARLLRSWLHGAENVDCVAVRFFDRLLMTGPDAEQTVINEEEDIQFEGDNIACNSGDVGWGVTQEVVRSYHDRMFCL